MFSEETLDLGYNYGAIGGPVFATTVVPVANGREFRNQRWSSSRGEWKFGQLRLTTAERDYWQDFFHARRGRLEGFRYRDWNDYLARDQLLTLDGGPTAQLIKHYDEGSASAYIRDILKPRTGATFARGGGAYAPTYSTATGIVTFAADSSTSVTGVTKANPAVVTSVAHGLSTGDKPYLSGIGGMTELNGVAYAITVLGPDSFSLNGVNSTGFSAYTSGGTVKMYPQPADAASPDTVRWTGEFDVPVRFDSDAINLTFLAWASDDRNIYDFGGLGVVEIRDA